jgi:hypothetical protein
MNITKPALLAGVASTLLIVASLAWAADSAVPPPLNIGQVEVNAAEHTSVTPFEISAFVPTGSDGRCLITLAESNFPIQGTTIFCGVREVEGVKGLFIHIFLPEPAPFDATWLVNLYQEHAHGYGSPVAYEPPAEPLN